MESVAENVTLFLLQNHHMAVHALRWNPFHQNIFASCGADWTVKIWDHTLRYTYIHTYVHKVYIISLDILV